MLTGYYIIAMSGCVKSVMHDTMAYDKRKCLFYNYLHNYTCHGSKRDVVIGMHSKVSKTGKNKINSDRFRI